jgi:hypothetical protein
VFNSPVASLSGANSGDFTVGTSGSCASGPANGVAFGGSCTLVVQFTPPGAESSGSKTATVTVNDNGSNVEEFTVSGTVSPSIVLGGGTVGLSVTQLGFGTVGFGGSLGKALTITNTNATSSLDVAGLVVSGAGFSLTSSNCGTLAPGASCTVHLTYAPTLIGTQAGSLTITTPGATNGNTHTVALVGKGA